MGMRHGDQLAAGDVAHVAGTDWTVIGTVSGTLTLAKSGAGEVIALTNGDYDVTPAGGVKLDDKGNEVVPTPLNETDASHVEESA